jgi:hypothetical protein
MFFGDIALHHDHLLDQLPEDAVLLNWNYESDKSFLPESQRFLELGLRFYNCPGTSAWCSLTGRLGNALDNLRDAAEAAIRCGAEGCLITDWGDYGHWQPPILSLPPLVYGAGVAWSLQSNRDPQRVASVIGQLIANDPSDKTGHLVMQIGRIHDRTEVKLDNATWWFRYLQEPANLIDPATWQTIAAGDVRRSLEGLDSAQQALDRYQPRHPEARLAKRELTWCVDLASWVCRRVVEGAIPPGEAGPRSPAGSPASFTDQMRALIDTYRSLWVKRSRTGGLVDSAAKLDRQMHFARPPAQSPPPPA